MRVEDGRTVYDFAETDAIAELLHRAGVRPYWSYSYVPGAVRAPDGDWRTMAEDDGPWVDMVAAYAGGAAARGVTIGYHELYNEPDLRDERTGEPVFYAGDLQDYLDLYRHAAPAIRAANPHGLVGGPALASVNANPHWLRAFLDMVTEEDLPLDFLSFHHYGTYGLASVLNTVISILAQYPQLDEVELHLNEYNSFTIDYPQGGMQDGYLMASAFADDAARLLRTRRLTRTSWAQFLDSGNDNYSGMVTIDGHPKPLLHAYEFLQQMPVDAREVHVDGPPGVGALASADHQRGAVMIWNRATHDIELEVSSTGSHAPTRQRLIDSRRTGADATDWDGQVIRLERGATALLEYGETVERGPTARRVRRARYNYSDRLEGAWTDIDEVDGSVRFGTGSQPAATLRAGYDLTADDSTTSDDDIEVTLTFADGSPAPGRVRVDRVDRGETATLWFTLTDAPAHVFAVARRRTPATP